MSEAQHDEYRKASSYVATEEGYVPETDGKGRVLAKHMSDREIAEESLILLRAFGDALSALGQNPMLRAMPGMSGLLGGK